MKGANPRADCDSVSARGGRDRTPLKNQELASAAVADLGSRFRQDILTWCFVRTHMSLIVSGTISSGLLATTVMHLLGVQSMAVRYPLAVLASYLGFFGLVRLWIAYALTSRSTSDPDPIDFDASPGVGLSGGSRGSTVSGGGGSSGGAGASGSWDGTEVNDSSSSSGLDIDLHGDIDVNGDIDVDVDVNVDVDVDVDLD